jgi:transposase
MFISSLVKKYYQYKKKHHHLPTIKRIPSDDIWNEIKNILPKEKPCNTKGHPAAVVPFRKVLDGILFVLRTECQCKKMLPKECGSGSTCHRRFQQWVRMGVFQKLGVRLLKIFDDLEGIKWKWQSLDSSVTTIKAPLGRQ